MHSRSCVKGTAFSLRCITSPDLPFDHPVQGLGRSTKGFDIWGAICQICVCMLTVGNMY